jgi:ubiquinol-cytochrome c reductase iron-sulfur subunit
MAETSTRLVLRVGVKLMALLSIGFALYALLVSVHSDNDEAIAVQPILFHLTELPENQALRVPWAGGNLILVRRNALSLASLAADTGELLDPASGESRQPDGLPVSTRSLRPEIFVAFDRGTDMGCPLSWLPPDSREAPLQPWHGGFRDSCRGSWYDAAGRVFKAQQAGRNLDIPPYRFRDKDLLEIGQSGDNAAPAN